MSEYRINVRFNPKEESQRRAAEFLENLDRKKYGSRNAFAVKAICTYVDELENSNPNARLLEDIRRLLLEVVPTVSISPTEPPKPKTLTSDLTDEQKQKQAASALAFLKGF